MPGHLYLPVADSEAEAHLSRTAHLSPESVQFLFLLSLNTWTLLTYALTSYQAVSTKRTTVRASSVLITGGACLLILCLAVFVIRNVAAFAFAYSGAAAGQVDTERLRQLVASNLVWT